MQPNIPTLDEWNQADELQRRRWRAARWLVNGRMRPNYPTGVCTYDELAIGPAELTAIGSAPQFGQLTMLQDEPGRRKATRRKKAA